MSNYNIDVSVLAQALREGASQEDIANLFASALNQASATVKQEKAKKEEEARKTAELQKKKNQHAQLVADFYNTYYPEMFDKEKATADTIIKACESIKKIAVSANELVMKLSDLKNIENSPLSRFFSL